MPIEKAKALIIDHLNELKEILFSVDGSSDSTMMSIYISDTHSYVLAFDRNDIDKENFDNDLIKLTIWHDDGMIEDESSRKEKTNG